MRKKILIIGNSAKEYALAKKLSETCEVYVSPGSDTIKEFAQIVDIRETSVSELLKFAEENGINLTVPCTDTTLNSDIADVFTKNNQQIFAPSSGARKIISDKALMKKVLYKLRIPTPKFGIFEKPSMAMDYIKNLKNPFVIKTNDPSSAVILTSQHTAKTIAESYFAQKTGKIIVEDYVYGTPFSFYTVTDGYKALPLGSSITYKHALEGEGGQLTSGMGACVPNYKLSVDNEYFLMDNVIYPLLDYMEINKNPYTGILGADGIITEEGKLQILSYRSFMQDCDAQAVLEIIDENLYNLFESCVIGSFSDEVEYILQKNMSAVSLTLVCKNKENKENVISGFELLEEETLKSFYPQVRKNRYLEYEAEHGPVMVLTSLARTSASASAKVYNEAENVNFSGISYRKDICRTLAEMY